jgi:hypothetical protein
VRRGQGTHGYRDGGTGQGLKRWRSWFPGRSAGRPRRRQQEGAQGALGDGGAQGWRRRADGYARDGHGQGEVQGTRRNQGGRGIGVAQGEKE